MKKRPSRMRRIASGEHHQERTLAAGEDGEVVILGLQVSENEPGGFEILHDPHQTIERAAD